jgi:hypothetical protein
MGTKGNQVPEITNENQEIDKLRVSQDFNNKKANSHATIFVASMFALFTVLSLATRIVKTPISSNCALSNYAVLGFSIFSYILIWLFGFYSLANFAYYSTAAFHAEHRIVGGMDRELMSGYMEGKKNIFRTFVSFKLNSEGRIRRNNEWISVLIYLAIGLLPFFAFIIWVISG